MNIPTLPAHKYPNFRHPGLEKILVDATRWVDFCRDQHNESSLIQLPDLDLNDNYHLMVGYVLAIAPDLIENKRADLPKIGDAVLFSLYAAHSVCGQGMGNPGWYILHPSILYGSVTLEENSEGCSDSL